MDGPSNSTRRQREMAKDEEVKSYAETIGVEPVSLPVAGLICQLCWMDKQVPLLIGESAIGKTAILKQMARYNDYRFELYALAHMESTDLTGPMYASRSKPDTYTFLRDGRIPFDGFEDRNEKVLVATDEANRAEMTTLNAAFPLWTERRIGPHKLGPNVVVAAAMNPPDGDYAVTSQFSQDPAMRRRVCQIYVTFNIGSFLEYARNPSGAKKIPEGFQSLDFGDPEVWEEERRNRPFHGAVLDFIGAKPDLAMDRKSRDAGKVYACPATWEAVSDTLYTVERLGLDVDDPTVRQVVRAKIGGNVGAAIADEVLAFYQKVTEALIPREVLLDFRKGTPIYKKVTDAIRRGDNGTIASLLEGIAIELHSPDDDAMPFTLEEVIPQLGLLYLELPPQLGRALDAARVDIEKQRTRGMHGRILQVQKLLNRNADFNAAHERNNRAYEESREEMLRAEEEFRAQMQASPTKKSA